MGLHSSWAEESIGQNRIQRAKGIYMLLFSVDCKPSPISHLPYVSIFHSPFSVLLFLSPFFYSCFLQIFLKNLILRTKIMFWNFVVVCVFQHKFLAKEICDASDHTVVKMTQCAAIVGKRGTQELVLTIMYSDIFDQFAPFCSVIHCIF